MMLTTLCLGFLVASLRADCKPHAKPPRSSWWQCPDEDFHALQAREQPRMLGLDDRHRPNLTTAADSRVIPGSFPESELTDGES